MTGSQECNDGAARVRKYYSPIYMGTLNQLDIFDFRVEFESRFKRL